MFNLPSFPLLLLFQDHLLRSFQAEQAARYFQFKQHQAPPKAKTRDADIQCHKESKYSEANSKCQHPMWWRECCYTNLNIRYGGSDRFHWCHANLKEQRQHPYQIVPKLTALKPTPRENSNEGSNGPLLTTLLSDSLTAITTICPDSTQIAVLLQLIPYLVFTHPKPQSHLLLNPGNRLVQTVHQ